MSSFVAVGTPRRFVSILISSAFKYNDSEMELTRTCCFEFDRMRREVSKGLFLCHGSFYLLLACFTSLSPLPEVDKTCPFQVAGVKCLSDTLSDIRGVANTNIYNMSLTGGWGGVSE